MQKKRSPRSESKLTEEGIFVFLTLVIFFVAVGFPTIINTSPTIGYDELTIQKLTPVTTFYQEAYAQEERINILSNYYYEPIMASAFLVMPTTIDNLPPPDPAQYFALKYSQPLQLEFGFIEFEDFQNFITENINKSDFLPPEIKELLNYEFLPSAEGAHLTPTLPTPDFFDDFTTDKGWSFNGTDVIDIFTATGTINITQLGTGAGSPPNYRTMGTLNINDLISGGWNQDTWSIRTKLQMNATSNLGGRFTLIGVSEVNQTLMSGNSNRLNCNTDVAEQEFDKGCLSYFGVFNDWVQAMHNSTVGTDGFGNANLNLTETYTLDSFIYPEMIYDGNFVRYTVYSDADYQHVLGCTNDKFDSSSGDCDFSSGSNKGISGVYDLDTGSSGVRWDSMSHIFFGASSSVSQDDAGTQGSIHEVSFWNLNITEAELPPTIPTADFFDDFTTDKGWISNNTANISLQTSTGTINVTDISTGIPSDSKISLNLDSMLTDGWDETKWTLRSKVQFNFSDATTLTFALLGVHELDQSQMTGSLVNGECTSDDGISAPDRDQGCFTWNGNTFRDFKMIGKNDTDADAGYSPFNVNVTGFGTDLTLDTFYYPEIIVDGNFIRATVYTDANYQNVLGCTNDKFDSSTGDCVFGTAGRGVTRVSNIDTESVRWSNLNYLWFGQAMTVTGTSGGIQGSIHEVSFWNGVNLTESELTVDPPDAITDLSVIIKNSTAIYSVGASGATQTFDKFPTIITQLAPTFSSPTVIDSIQIDIKETGATALPVGTVKAVIVGHRGADLTVGSTLDDIYFIENSTNSISTSLLPALAIFNFSGNTILDSADFDVGIGIVIDSHDSEILMDLFGSGAFGKMIGTGADCAGDNFVFDDEGCSGVATSDLSGLNIFGGEPNAVLSWTEPAGSPTGYEISIANATELPHLFEMNNNQGVGGDQIKSIGTLADPVGFAGQRITFPNDVTITSVATGIGNIGIDLTTGTIQGVILKDAPNATGSFTRVANSTQILNGSAINALQSPADAGRITVSPPNCCIRTFGFDGIVLTADVEYVIGIEAQADLNNAITVFEDTPDGIFGTGNGVFTTLSSLTSDVWLDNATGNGNLNMHIYGFNFTEEVANTGNTDTEYTSTAIFPDFAGKINAYSYTVKPINFIGTGNASNFVEISPDRESFDAWQYREVDNQKTFDVDCNFFNDPTTFRQEQYFRIGTCQTFKIFNATELTGSDIKVTGSFGTNSRMQVIDGAYDKDSFADFPKHVNGLQKGAGLLNSTNLTICGSPCIIPASSIDYASSTESEITVFMTHFKGGTFPTQGMTIEEISISNIGTWNFTESPRIIRTMNQGLAFECVSSPSTCDGTRIDGDMQGVFEDDRGIVVVNSFVNGTVQVLPINVTINITDTVRVTDSEDSIVNFMSLTYERDRLTTIMNGDFDQSSPETFDGYIGNFYNASQTLPPNQPIKIKEVYVNFFYGSPVNASEVANTGNMTAVILQNVTIGASQSDIITIAESDVFDLTVEHNYTVRQGSFQLGESVVFNFTGTDLTITDGTFIGFRLQDVLLDANQTVFSDAFQFRVWTFDEQRGGAPMPSGNGEGFCVVSNATDTFSLCPVSIIPDGAPLALEVGILVEDTPTFTTTGGIEPDKLIVYHNFDSETLIDSAYPDTLFKNAGTLQELGDISVLNNQAVQTNITIVATTGLIGEGAYVGGTDNTSTDGDGMLEVGFSDVNRAGSFNFFTNNQTLTDTYSMNFWVKGTWSDVSDDFTNLIHNSNKQGENGFHLSVGVGGEIYAEMFARDVDVLGAQITSATLTDDTFGMVSFIVEKSNATDAFQICVDTVCESFNKSNEFGDQEFINNKLMIGDFMDSNFEWTSDTNSEPALAFTIDELCIWENHKLTPAQLTTLFNSGSGVTCGTVNESSGGLNVTFTAGGVTNNQTQIDTVTVSDQTDVTTVFEQNQTDTVTVSDNVNTTKSTLPSQVTGLNIIQNLAPWAYMTWDDVANADSYNIYWKHNLNQPEFKRIAVVTDNKYTDKRLPYHKQNCEGANSLCDKYLVSANNATGEGLNSTEFDFGLMIPTRASSVEPLSSIPDRVEYRQTKWIFDGNWNSAFTVLKNLGQSVYYRVGSNETTIHNASSSANDGTFATTGNEIFGQKITVPDMNLTRIIQKFDFNSAFPTAGNVTAFVWNSTDGFIDLSNDTVHFPVSADLKDVTACEVTGCDSERDQSFFFPTQVPLSAGEYVFGLRFEDVASTGTHGQGVITTGTVTNIITDDMSTDPASNGWTEGSIALLCNGQAQTATGSVSPFNGTIVQLAKTGGGFMAEITMSKTFNLTGFSNNAVNITALHSTSFYDKDCGSSAPNPERFMSIEVDTGSGFVEILKDVGALDLPPPDTIDEANGNFQLQFSGNIAMGSSADNNSNVTVKITHRTSEIDEPLFLDNFEINSVGSSGVRVSDTDWTDGVTFVEDTGKDSNIQVIGIADDWVLCTATMSTDDDDFVCPVAIDLIDDNQEVWIQAFATTDVFPFNSAGNSAFGRSAIVPVSAFSARELGFTPVSTGKINMSALSGGSSPFTITNQSAIDSVTVSDQTDITTMFEQTEIDIVTVIDDAQLTPSKSNTDTATANDQTVLISPPFPITTLVASTVGNICELTWTSPPNGGSAITKFQIFRSVAGGAFSLLLNQTFVNHTDTGLINLVTYQYNVTSINAFGDSEPSNIESCMPIINNPPNEPTLLDANEIVNGDVVLDWTEPTQGSPTGYLIERKVGAGGFLVLVANTGNSLTTFTDTTTDPAMKYTYRIAGINAFGTGTFSNEATVTTASPAFAPILSGAQNVDQIDISWTVPASDNPINGYKIERRINVGAFSVLVANTTTTLTTFTDTNVTKPDTFGYRVRALSSAGEGTVSNIVDIVFGSHIIVQVREQDGSGFKGGGSVKGVNSTFNQLVGLNVNSNAIFDNLAVGNFNFTFFDDDNFILNKTFNFPAPAGNDTTTFTINALVFDVDCPVNGVGADIRIKVNYTDVKDITEFPSTPVCDSTDQISWSTRWQGSAVNDTSTMIADFISTIFKANAEQFLASADIIPTVFNSGDNQIESETYVVNMTDVTINFNLFLGRAPAGGGGGGSGSQPTPSITIPDPEVVFEQRLTGLSLLSRTHQFAQAGDVIEGSITVNWEGELNLEVVEIDTSATDLDIRFEFPRFPLDQRVEGSGEFAMSSAEIPYTIVLEAQECNPEIGVTQNCFDPLLHTVPIELKFERDGQIYEASTEVFVDGRPIPLDIVQLQIILLFFVLIASAVFGRFIRNRARGSTRRTKTKKKKFQKKFDSS